MDESDELHAEAALTETKGPCCHYTEGYVGSRVWMNINIFDLTGNRNQISWSFRPKPSHYKDVLDPDPSSR
jgi:hypothetical protein